MRRLDLLFFCEKAPAENNSNTEKGGYIYQKLVYVNELFKKKHGK